MTTRAIAEALRTLVATAAATLATRDEAWAGRAPAPGRWCPKELIGHLIDSASINHQRFVRARFRDDLCFEGYDQDAWVAAQAYRDVPWSELVDLWRALNLHLARVIEQTPAARAEAARSEHALERIAWETVPAREPATLAYFMADYLGHLRHHLHTLDPTLSPPPGRQRRP